MKLVYAIALSAALFLCDCGTDPQPERTIKAGVYENAAIGLKITFPAAWQIKTDQAYGNAKADILALGVPINGFSPNLSVILESHTGSTNMTEILVEVKGALQTQIADLSACRDTVEAIDGKEVGEINYESSVNGACCISCRCIS